MGLDCKPLFDLIKVTDIPEKEGVGVIDYIVDWGWTLFTFFFGWVLVALGKIHFRISKLKDDHNSLAINIAENYIKKDDFKEEIREIKTTIEKGFDKLSVDLKGKRDK